MTPEEFVRQVHVAMEDPKGAEDMWPMTLLSGKAIAVQKVLNRYRDQLPHVESTSTMEVSLPVFKELSGQ